MTDLEKRLLSELENALAFIDEAVARDVLNAQEIDEQFADTRKAVARAREEIKRPPHEELANAKLVTVACAPGYRSVSLLIDITPVRGHTRRFDLNVPKQDAAEIHRHIQETHRLAWRGGDPIDKEPGEQRPSWL